MRFVLFTSALDGDDAVLDHLDRLVDRVADEVHRIEVQDADLLQGSAWYRSARQTRRKILTTALANPPRARRASQGPHVKSVEVTDRESAALADKLAHTPLVVLVEDRETDGAFLEILVEELGWPALQELWKCAQEVTPRALEVDSAGGIGNIPSRIERAAEDAKREGRPLRLFMLCDSDARWSGDSGHAPRGVENARKVCSQRDVPHHVWKKRCAENYIPDAVFEVLRADPRSGARIHRIEALLRRSRPQRDYFPLKSGLKPEERDQAIAQGLYDPSDGPDLMLLEESFFPNRSRPLQLLCQERREEFTADGLRERDGESEIEALLQAIAKEL